MAPPNFWSGYATDSRRGESQSITFSGEILVASPSVLSMLTLVIKHVSISSILFDHSKHHYRSFNSPFKIVDWLLDRP